MKELKRNLNLMCQSKLWAETKPREMKTKQPIRNRKIALSGELLKRGSSILSFSLNFSLTGGTEACLSRISLTGVNTLQCHLGFIYAFRN